MKKFKIIQKLTCLALAIMMLLLTTACGKGGEDSSDYTYSEYEIVEEVVVGGENDSDDKQNGDDSNEKTNNKSKADKTNSKNESSTQQKNNAATSSKGETSKNETVNSGSNSEKKNNINGTTVKVLLWYNPPKRETSVAEAFTKKTGCKVQFVRTSSGSAYFTKLASLVASGSAPEAASFGGATYPSSIVRGLFDELDSKYFDLNDKVWSKDVMDCYRWDNKYYGVAAKGSMFGDFFVCYFNKTLFEERGQQTPYEIWKNNPNEWTWSKMRELAKSMTYGSGDDKVHGLSILRGYEFMLTTGKDFINVSGNKITNTSNDDLVKKGWKFVNDIYSIDKSMVEGNASEKDLINRKAAMLIEGQWLMQNEQSLATQMKDEWGVAPFPKYDDAAEYYVPFCGNLWGVGKGAKNVAGAAEFLKYWLNPENEEVNVYASKECREVHEWVWNQKKGVNYSEGVLNFKDSKFYSNLRSQLFGGSQNVDMVINSNKGAIDSAINAVMDELV